VKPARACGAGEFSNRRHVRCPSTLRAFAGRAGALRKRQSCEKAVIWESDRGALESSAATGVRFACILWHGHLAREDTGWKPVPRDWLRPNAAWDFRV